VPGIAIALLFLGYSTGYYGITQIQGGNWGFLDLVVPSRWASAASTPRDGAPGSGVSGSALAASQASQKLSALQAQQNTQNTPPTSGGTGYQPTGSGVVTGTGGITYLYGAQGQVSCIDKKGNIVPCPS
jgi:hypothetical protein